MRRRTFPDLERLSSPMLGIVIALLLATLAYALCGAVGLPSLVALAAAILVLVAAAPTDAWGLGGRLGGRSRI